MAKWTKREWNLRHSNGRYMFQTWQTAGERKFEHDAYAREQGFRAGEEKEHNIQSDADRNQIKADVAGADSNINYGFQPKAVETETTQAQAIADSGE